MDTTFSYKQYTKITAFVNKDTEILTGSFDLDAQNPRKSFGVSFFILHPIKTWESLR
jgi:hypothetical protein